jgi:hypothetical protein
MAVDHIRYDILVQQALRGMVRDVLGEIDKTKVLPGEHHFFITFDTTADSVQVSDRLRAQYPEEMTIVLQHQFWDLKVTEDRFEVGLSFGGVPERLVVPFDAIKAFSDPSVQFTLQFETLPEPANQDDEAPKELAKSPAEEKEKKRGPRGKGSVPSSPPSLLPVAAVSEDSAEPPKEPPDGKGGAEVVRLDRFRKK